MREVQSEQGRRTPAAKADSTRGSHMSRTSKAAPRMPRMATMPIPTTIHRRPAAGVSMRNLGEGNSAADGSGRGSAAVTGAGGAGTGAVTCAGTGASTGRAASKTRPAGPSGRKRRVEESFEAGTAGIPTGICRTGSASRLSSRQGRSARMLPSAWRKKNPMRVGWKVCGFNTSATCHGSGKKRLWMARSASDRKISLRVWE